MTDAYILNIIICKLGYWQEFYLIILLITNKYSKVGFHNAKLLFGLIISLRMEGNKELSLDSKEVAERKPKL